MLLIPPYPLVPAPMAVRVFGPPALATSPFPADLVDAQDFYVDLKTHNLVVSGNQARLEEATVKLVAGAQASGGQRTMAGTAIVKRLHHAAVGEIAAWRR